MKKLIFSILLFASVATFAATPADTIVVDNSKITNVVKHNGTTSTGKTSVKYYFVYDGELISTNNTTVGKYELAKQYKAKCPLILIKRGRNKRIVLY